MHRLMGFIGIILDIQINFLSTRILIFSLKSGRNQKTFAICNHYRHFYQRSVSDKSSIFVTMSPFSSKFLSDGVVCITIWDFILLYKRGYRRRRKHGVDGKKISYFVHPSAIFDMETGFPLSPFLLLYLLLYAKSKV